VDIVDSCLSISCPFGEHCVALDEFNTTCKSNCPHSNCISTTVVPDIDRCVVSNPCQNHGSCYMDASGYIACRCPFNVRGRFCDSLVNMCVQFRCVICTENFYNLYRIAHDFITLSVCLSVCLSGTRVIPDKTEERSVQIFYTIRKNI